MSSSREADQLIAQPKSLEEMELQQPLSERVLRPIVQRLSRIASRGDSGGLIARADAKLERAGYPGGLRGADWMGVKLLVTIVLGLGVALLMLAIGAPGLALLFGVAGAGLGYMAPEFWLGGKARKRSFAMVLQLPDALDLLTISVEAGLGFDAALAKVVRAQGSNRPLASEFLNFQHDMMAGMSRTQALRQLGRRADVSSLSTFTSALVQAEQVGASMAETLQHQANDLRQRRRENALLQAQALPVKLVFPLVVCFLPGIFATTLAPVLFQMVQVANGVLLSSGR